jgi:hypothetical protein
MLAGAGERAVEAEIGAVDRLGLLHLSRVEQEGPERVARRLRPAPGLVIGKGIVWWRHTHPEQPAPAPTAAAPPPAVNPMAPTPVPVPPPPAEIPIQHPVQPASEPKGKSLPPLDESDAYTRDLLLQLMGKRAPFFVSFDGFARRFVTTVDNLGKEQASPQMWPVHPTPGAFEAEVRNEGTVPSARNAARYTAFVQFVELVDARKAAAVYRRLYPLFQQAYEDLGTPGPKYFNDRLVAVIDHLLATPEVTGPIPVKLVEATGAPGAQKSPRLFQFADPKHEARSAGQKILLRMGRQNADRLKAKLRQVRGHLARG